jgi:hypothetical protein
VGDGGYTWAADIAKPWAVEGEECAGNSREPSANKEEERSEGDGKCGIFASPIVFDWLREAGGERLPLARRGPGPGVAVGEEEEEEEVERPGDRDD